jgi:hypothetical protein
MREDLLRQFFLAGVSVECLVEDLRNSVKYLDAVESTVSIEDMKRSFLLERQPLIRLCDAALSSALPSESLTTLGFCRDGFRPLRVGGPHAQRGALGLVMP